MAEKNKMNIEVYKLLIQQISEAVNIDILANNLTQLLVGALGIKGAAIFILDPDLEELELLASSGLSLDYINKGPLLVDKSIKLGPNREPVIVRDTTSSDQLQYPQKAADEGVKAIVSYPITMRGKVIGSLRLYHSEKWDISEEDIAFVEVLAKTTGVSLMYFRVANAVNSVKETITDIHSVWL